MFDLKGKIVREIHDIQRPNNVDIAYGLMLGGKPTDIAVTTERFTHKLRIFALPDLKPVDAGGLAMFEGDTAAGFRDLMGIALYRAKSGVLYAMVGRKVIHWPVPDQRQRGRASAGHTRAPVWALQRAKRN